MDKSARRRRKYLTVTIVTLIFIIQVIVFFLINKKLNEYTNDNPQYDCDDVKTAYGADFDKYAVIQWNNGEKDVKTEKNDALLCFCSEFYGTYGITKTFISTFQTKTHSGQVIIGKICKDWVKILFKIQALGYMFSILIAIFGTILRNIIIALINFIGQRTFAKQFQKTLEVLFVTFFINSIFVIVLVNTNLEKTRLPILKDLFTGQFTDFSRDWYDKIGSIIVFSQIIMIISTPIDCAVRLVTARIKVY